MGKVGPEILSCVAITARKSPASLLTDAGKSSKDEGTGATED